MTGEDDNPALLVVWLVTWKIGLFFVFRECPSHPGRIDSSDYYLDVDVIVNSSGGTTGFTVHTRNAKDDFHILAALCMFPLHQEAPPPPTSIGSTAGRVIKAGNPVKVMTL